ncbi:beta-lactamase family protein [Streptomyces sp. NBC_01387]|uniref:serine hydrolase domain-containing protein n=1 Tax=unclassified Streptomyces TaxID=2593676 RepID=UPI0020247AD8|nr:serine hydrolase domain-containing protein [Streptomyces sp. A 4/2]
MSDDDTALRERLEHALTEVRAPDVVLAVTRNRRRTVVSGGTTPAPVLPRASLRYELGSLSKTFTGLLLAELDRCGELSVDDAVADHLPLPPRLPRYARRITLRHLATHTSGLPRVPRDMIAGAVLRPYANGYAHYDTGRLLHAFTRTRTRHAPGSRWHYSNFGLALLGSALEHATGTRYAALLADRVLEPLRLTGATTDPGSGDGDDSAFGEATGHRSDGRTPLPRSVMTGFAPAGAVRATPADLLTYAEAHLYPASTPLDGALRKVQIPLLRRGLGHRHTHTLTWFRHPAPGGPMFFHAGASFGQQVFAGYHPASGTGIAGTATRHDRACRIVKTAYALLYELGSVTPADG